MIAESKEFKTITLRGLDERADLVQILNEVMNERNIKTGQSTIEYIILNYSLLIAENRRLRKQIATDELAHWSTQRVLEVENDELKEAVKAVKNAFAMINKLEL